MSNYTFAELLTVFYHLHQDLENRKTQAELAQALGVSRRTVNGWFAGDYGPRTPDVVEKLAQALCLTAFQADLLFYAVNPAWVKYGTPSAVLEMAEVIRYREEEAAYKQTPAQAAPALTQIEREWRLVFRDTFESNYQRWGVGVKENGMGRLARTICDQRYHLSLQNQYHEDVFMGGDSNCFAPEMYYLTVQAQLVQGSTEADGYGLLFEEINDECYACLRIREKLGKASVVQTLNGGDQSTVYLNRVPVPVLHPHAANKVAVLAIHADHWFYVNDVLIGSYTIPRLPYARLDVGIVAGPQQHALCNFSDFRVYAPPDARLYPTVEKLTGLTLEHR